MSPQGKDCAEIGVSRYEDAIFRHGSFENHQIRFRLEANLPYMHSIKARIA